MATKNRNVMCYLPSYLEEELTDYAYSNDLTRYDSKKETTEPRLGTAIVEALKDYFSQRNAVEKYNPEAFQKSNTNTQVNDSRKYSTVKEYNTQGIEQVKDSIQTLQKELKLVKEQYSQMAQQLNTVVDSQNKQQQQIAHLEESKLSCQLMEDWAEPINWESFDSAKEESKLDETPAKAHDVGDSNGNYNDASLASSIGDNNNPSDDSSISVNQEPKANDQNNQLYFGTKELAKHIGIEARTIRNHLKPLNLGDIYERKGQKWRLIQQTPYRLEKIE